MFEISVVVSDDKLSDALHAMKPHIVRFSVKYSAGGFPASSADSQYANAPQGSPGRATGPRKHRLKQEARLAARRNTRFGGAVRVMREALKKVNAGDTITARDLKGATIAKGYSGGAYSHGIKLMLKSGELSRQDHGVYTVNHAAAAPQQAAQAA